jgi:hypothetical protein
MALHNWLLSCSAAPAMLRQPCCAYGACWHHSFWLCCAQAVCDEWSKRLHGMTFLVNQVTPRMHPSIQRCRPVIVASMPAAGQCAHCPYR